ncbi:hypothetical protein ACHAWU_001302 [Discostella pseudostelligera]|uniref:Uncharacterized protein n=1 Tax=Discostella pseudostelligera TaxID=259834 RepID=A0ABD3MG56_9STRA
MTHSLQSHNLQNWVGHMKSAIISDARSAHSQFLSRYACWKSLKSARIRLNTASVIRPIKVELKTNLSQGHSQSNKCCTVLDRPVGQISCHGCSSCPALDHMVAVDACLQPIQGH